MPDPISIFPLFVENQVFPPTVSTVSDAGDLQAAGPPDIEEVEPPDINSVE